MAILTVQDAVDGLAPAVSWRVVLKFLWIISLRLSGPILALFPNFAGFLPYRQWKCLENSTTCLTRVNISGISRKSFCGVKGEEMLVVGHDMVWELDGRKTYAVDWDLLCGREYLGTFISSSYFVGALAALLICSSLYDKYGRLKISQITQIISIVLGLMMAFPFNLWYMMIVRCLYGGFYFIANTGYHVLIIEMMPKPVKAKGMTISQTGWAGGQFILALIAYLFKDWKFIVIFGTVLLCLNLYAIFCIVPESPLYFLSNKRNEFAAKESLKKLAMFFGSDRNFDDDDLVDAADKDRELKEQSLLDALRDFVKYPVLSKHVAILLFVWLKCGWLYYGFTFSWGTLGRNLYISYLLNGCGEALSIFVLLIYLEKLPRRSLAIFDMVAAAMLFIAITPDSIGFKAISVSQLACLIGALANGLVFGAHFLWTQELSPTTHRGRILSLANSSSRIGSLLGPQASLMFAWNKTATLCIFASVALVSGVLMLLLPETRRSAMPSLASDVISRAEQRKLIEQKSIQN